MIHPDEIHEEAEREEGKFQDKMSKADDWREEKKLSQLYNPFFLTKELNDYLPF